jgi:hypothetical protein
MTTDHEDGQRSRVLRREVESAIVAARRAKSEYQQAATAGAGVSPQVRATLRDTAIDLFNALRWWRDEGNVEEVWTEHDLDQFGALLDQRVQTQGGSHPRLSRPGDQQPRTGVAQLGTDDLVRYIEGMLMVAKALGFAPSISEPTTRTEITKEDMEKFEEWRQQQI